MGGYCEVIYWSIPLSVCLVANLHFRLLYALRKFPFLGLAIRITWCALWLVVTFQIQLKQQTGRVMKLQRCIECNQVWVQGRRGVLLFLGAVLFLAMVVGIVGSRLTPVRSYRMSLRSLFPDSAILRGWEVRRQPVAETLEMQRAVGEILSFTDAEFAHYSNGGLRVSVFLAYWEPGRMSHRLVAGHSPDVCWVGGGWSLRSTESVVVTTAAIIGDAMPFEYRVFELNGQAEYVIFCHLLGGEPMTYRTLGRPPWHAMFSDLFTLGLRQREEQFFVRISSNRPFAEFKEALPLQLFLKQLVRAARGQP